MRAIHRILLALSVLSGFLALGAAADAATAVACRSPRFVTSKPDAMWSQGRYIVHNNMWNASNYRVKQRLRACSYHNWSVRVTADNHRRDGAVKTYPNVHEDFHNWSTGHEPRVRSFGMIQSRFAARTPNRGIYDAAYDIWLNGVPGNNEVMIWTRNRGQSPAGRRIARAAHVGKHTWRVYATRGNHYIAFVPHKRINHGRIHIKAMLSWLMRHHRLSKRATLGQICFGFEVVSTNAKPTTFKVDNFRVRYKRR